MVFRNGLLDVITNAATAQWDGELSSSNVHCSDEVCWDPSSQGDHQLLWCPRPGGSVAVHRFTLHISEYDLADLRELARREMSISTGETCSGSNVGGYHGDRDLWWRLQTDLQTKISTAVRQAAEVEARELGRAPIPTSPDEAWFNMLDAGNWNMLHTHPGSTYSGVVYISAPASCAAAGPDAATRNVSRHCEDAHARAGRLALVPSAYPSFSGDYTFDGFKLLAAPPARCDESLAHVRADATVAPSLAASQIVLLDQTPGTCVVFPSFVPHFVFPTGTDQSTQRLSIAFNFGAREPVVAHLLLLGDSRVRVILETVSNLAFRLPRSNSIAANTTYAHGGPDMLPVAKRLKH
eukprot:CAMPEP_0119317462 /NCGR_PEP_ID=MMETSP1333-20130426/43205_1 /TAXON_ID=418940 /ORGANISM="Scyphosphaera apsteinii, Strain RCC1455" /LENGTH=351 /DNA_ID=CAMNT_0007323399 /DNA_START=188 /DNA_END=1243 /DNA_ORIENTATION=-